MGIVQDRNQVWEWQKEALAKLADKSSLTLREANRLWALLVDAESREVLIPNTASIIQSLEDFITEKTTISTKKEKVSAICSPEAQKKCHVACTAKDCPVNQRQRQS